jgi:CheY-like chemotaxis protein
LGFSSLALKTSDPVMLQQYLDIIDQSSRSLMDLVNDILDMSKIEAGQVRLDSIPFNLVDTIDLLVWQYKPLAIQKKLDFQVSCATDLPTWISGDPLRLRQILVNLVTNSIKFTESGSITLTVTATASTQDEADISIRFAVHDTGIGIANDNLAFLFQPFWQNDSSSTRKYGGTGLGLAIVQSLAQLMRGRVEVTSVPGRGSCFTVALPFRIATPPAYQKIAPPIIVPLAVLVVEDNGFNRRFLGDLLTSLGHTVTLAENGFQALELTKQHCYDCIILDVRMPDMDGIELTRRLRAREKKQNLRPVPILACTGDTGSHTEQQCLAAGMKAVLAKPLNLDKFAQILSELGSSSLLGKTPAPPCQIADWIVADMGDNPARIEEYLQLLQDDIRGALDRLEQAIATDDRSALKAIAHTLKGLCGHLREKEPELLALRLHNGSLTWSRAELRNEATSLRSVCAQLLLNGRGDGK